MLVKFHIFPELRYEHFEKFVDEFYVRKWFFESKVKILEVFYFSLKKGGSKILFCDDTNLLN